MKDTGDDQGGIIRSRGCTEVKVKDTPGVIGGGGGGAS